MTDAIAHPDDEQLSAALDGEDEPGTRQHLRDCDACVARLAELDEVRHAVGGNVPEAPPGLADRAVAAALAAWTEERSAVVAERPGPDDLAPVVPLRRRVPGWVLGAAAAVAALLVAVPLLSRDSGNGGDEQFAASGAALEDTADAALVDGGDLGAQTDARALNQILQSTVAQKMSLSAPAPAAGAAEDASRASGEEGAAASPSAPDAPATESTSVTSTPPLTQYATTAGPAAPSPCATTVRSQFGAGLGALVYQADLVWRGTPAVVLAYELNDQAGDGPDRRAFVMARDGCELLVAQGF
jgi:hypothetical protein